MSGKYGAFFLVIISLSVLCGSALLSSDYRSVNSSSEEINSVNLWLAALRDRDENVRITAAYSLEGIDPDTEGAIPALLKALKDEDACVRRYVANALGEIGAEPKLVVPALADTLADEDQAVREHASIALAKVGEPAVPALVEILRDSDNAIRLLHFRGRCNYDPIFLPSFYAAFALGRIGEPAVLPIMKAFSGQNMDTHSYSYAIFALREIGEAAVPALVKFLESNNPYARLLAVDALSWIGPDARAASPYLVGMLKGRDEALRESVAAALSEIGADATAIPALEEMLKGADKDFRRRAAMQLANIGSDAVPILVDALKSEDNELRIIASSSLSWMPQVEAAVPDLIQALDDSNHEVRANVARALGRGTSAFRSAVPVLIKALTDPEGSVRQNAARSLGVIAEGVDEGLAGIAPALVESLGDPVSKVREETAVALGKIGEDSQIAVPALVQALGDSDPGVRDRVASAFGEIGASDPPIVDALAQLSLIDPSYNVRASAVDSLGKLGPAVRTAIPVLLKALENEELRENAVITLGKIGYKDERVTLALIQALKDPDRDVRASAAKSLGEIRVESAAPALLEIVLNEGTWGVGSTALNALGEIGLSAVPTLQKALESQDERVRERVIDILGEVDGGDKRIVEALVCALDDPSMEVRQSAVYYLGTIVPKAEAAIPALIESLNNATSDTRIESRSFETAVFKRVKLGRFGPMASNIRVEILRTFGKLGPLARDAVPALTPLLNDADPEVRRSAAEALGKIGQGAKAALKALLGAFKDQDANVRIAVAEAIISIGFDPVEIGPILIKVINDDCVHRYVATALDNMAEDFFKNFTECSATIGKLGISLPNLPWPPPQFSTWDVLPVYLLGTVNSKLRDIHERLVSALTATGFDEISLFAAPGGFAMVTRVERIHEDGTPYTGKDRWSREKIPLRSLNLIEYLRRLFFEEPGDFRLIAFIVTTQENLERSDDELPEDKARDLILEGGRVLPDEIGELSFKGRCCHVLIYHFQRKLGGISILQHPSPLTTKTHLVKGGIWSQLAP